MKVWAIKIEEREQAHTTISQGFPATIEAEGQVLANPIQRLRRLKEQIKSVRTLSSLMPTKLRSSTAVRQVPRQEPNSMWGQGVPSTSAKFRPNSHYRVPKSTAPRCYNCAQPGYDAHNCRAPCNSTDPHSKDSLNDQLVIIQIVGLQQLTTAEYDLCSSKLIPSAIKSQTARGREKALLTMTYI